jgi:hypothetical protein
VSVIFSPTVTGPEAVVVSVGLPQTGTVMVLLSSVTSPVCAKARPFKVAPVPRLIDVSARILPMNVVPEPIVAELATSHHTLQFEPVVP